MARVFPKDMFTAQISRSVVRFFQIVGFHCIEV